MRQSSIVASAVAALVALQTAGCGGAHTPRVASVGPPLTRTSSSPSAADQVAASRCMRSHGVPNFPDPIVLAGRPRFGFTVRSGVDPNTPRFKAALRYCTTRHRIFGNPATQAQKAKWRRAAVAYAACVRSHGVGNFPDPDASGLIELPSAAYNNLPNVARAESACRALRTTGVLFGLPVPSG